jgi:2-amino-4-hydroxy-6-hydroxymethyldihydropteridine diphosphokinase
MNDPMPVDNFMTPVALGLGSNIGDRLAALRAAVEAMKPFIEIEKLSPVYETAAAYVTDQPAFFNAVIVGRTALKPLPLLWQLKRIETEIGRLPTFRYGPRLLDIDILFYGDIVVSEAELLLPHPRMAERDFVLRPLADTAPEWHHPQTGQTAKVMLDALPNIVMKNLGDLLA